jgi:microcystin-dependent protein
MNQLRRFLALAAVLACVPVALVRAQTVAGAPNTIDYQGRALDASGAPLANTTPANYEMLFRIYDAQEGGAIVWSEKQIVTVSKGLFSVRLGEGTANGSEGIVGQQHLADAFNGKERFLGVTIVIPGQTPVEILPRLAFLATPFAYVANRSVSAERLVLNPSTTAAPSSLNVAQVSYATQAVNASTTLTDQHHTVIVDATAAPVSITLPGVTSRREYYIVKRDNTPSIITVTAPNGGTINGQTSIRLKAFGESVVIQNIGNNDWWTVSDGRDKTPVGTIIASGTPFNPPGYIYCDGRILDRTNPAHVDLFGAIGTSFGAPNATQFRVPDLRGLFLRGVDQGRGLDPDRNSRIAMNGGNVGDAIGSYQVDQNATHNHAFSASANTSGAGGHNHFTNGGAGQRGLARQSAGGERSTTDGVDSGLSGIELDVWYGGATGIPHDGHHSHSVTVSGTTGATGGAESRPKNLGVFYYIKY